MKTLTSTHSKFTASLKVDDNSLALFGYLGSNTGMVIQTAVSGSFLFTFHCVAYGVGTHDASYYTDPSGRLELPLRKFLQFTGAGHYCTFTVTATVDGVEDYVVFIVNVRNGISYCDILAPVSKEMDAFTGGKSPHAVTPPNVILMSEQFGDTCLAECSLSNEALATLPTATWSGYQSEWDTLTLLGDRSNEVPISPKFTRIRYQEGGAQRIWDLQFTGDCDDVCIIQWTSRTGALRRHVFYVADIEDDVDETATLSTIGDGYRAVKNTSQAFKVRVPGLTAYSWWYYADMIAASDLQCVTPGDGHWLGDGFCDAWCLDTQKVMPSGNGFVTFEATIRWRAYDRY